MKIVKNNHNNHNEYLDTFNLHFTYPVFTNKIYINMGIALKCCFPLDIRNQNNIKLILLCDSSI